jgi:hypothetical protein
MTSLQLGGPLLADPNNTIIMSLSPLTSRSSTPPTPLTAFTIPSPGPGPEENHKFISLPPSPPAPDANASDRAKKPDEDEGMHPTDIPLPPSPKIKQALPFRRPRVSNSLDRVVSGTQRTSSGRRVSSALQYAITQPLDTEFETADRAVSGESDASLDLAYYQEMVSEAMAGNDEDIEEIPWDSSLGFGGQLPDLVSDQGIVGDEDEAWMGFVRAQLNTLFPDFFDPNTREGNEGEGGGDVSISTIASSDLTTPPIGTRLGPGLGVGRGVPNIRSEIGGLTEEIERLRGVVSGLADGMRAAQLAPEVEGGVGVPLNDGKDIEAEVPEAFLKVCSSELLFADPQTAHLSIDIVRLIHISLGGIAVSDTELFSESNLLMIKHHFQVLQGEDTESAVAQ